MKKLITYVCLGLISSMWMFAADLVVYFNNVPDGSGIVKQSYTEYVMTAPAGGDIIYTKTITLPEGYYQYIVTEESNAGTITPRNGDWREINIPAGGQAVNFYAKLWESDNTRTQFISDAQFVSFYFWSPWGYHLDYGQIPYDESTKQSSIVLDVPQYASKIEFKAQIKCANNREAWQDLSDIEKHTIWSGEHGRYKFEVDHPTISFNYYKLLDEINTPLVKVDDADGFVDPTGSSFTSDLGEYSTSSALYLGGKITGTSIVAIDPANVTAKLYYEIIEDGESTGTIADIELEATAGGTVTSATWEKDNVKDISTGLANGDYTLRIWYETVCHGDIIKDDNSGSYYETTFSVFNNGSGINEASVNATVSSADGILTASFEGAAIIKLFTVSGQLIGQAIAEGNYIQAVNQGIYILMINDKAYKVAVK